MRTIPFVKLEGSGNDFILVDTRHTAGARLPRGSSRGGQGQARHSRLARSLSPLAQAWCDRKRGIGADGVVAVFPSRKGDARMRIFNPDGSEAEMCGNGLRCVAWYLHLKHHGKRVIRVETKAGPMEARIVGPERVRIRWARPRQLRLGLRLRAGGRRTIAHFVNTGVPHTVLFVSRMEEVRPQALGPVIRHHRLFKPGGTNVNWVRIHSPHRISIRTYERGVEGETLACGTGAVASVVIGTALGRLRPPVEVRTRGGDTLTVGFHPKVHPWEGLTLEGPARILFEGGISRG